MEGLFSPQKILKTTNLAARNRVPVEIRMDEDPRTYAGYFVTAATKHRTPSPANIHRLLQQTTEQMQGMFLSPVEPAFGNAHIHQAPHIYVQFAINNRVFRCVLKVLGQQAFGHLSLHLLSFPDALLRFRNRGEKRYRLPPQSAVTALVRSKSQQEVLAQVLDISRHGIAIQFPPGTRLFNREETMEVDLFAPAIGDFSFKGKLKHYSPMLHAEGENCNFVQCGIMLDTDKQKKRKEKKWQKLLAAAWQREQTFNRKRARGLLKPAPTTKN